MLAIFIIIFNWYMMEPCHSSNEQIKSRNNNAHMLIRLNIYCTRHELKEIINKIYVSGLCIFGIHS